MTSVGWATLDVIPSFDGFRGHLERGTGRDLATVGAAGGTTFGDAAGKSAGSRFGTVFKSAAKAGLVGIAGLAAGATKLAFDSISSASDLEESTNKVVQIFGKGSDSILKFSETTADALGQTNNQARTAAATFGIFGSAAGLADKKNAKFAKRMTVLASDLASFNNTDPSQAVEALGAALRGESEPIRAYGVMLDEATLKAEAMALGILKPVKNQSQIAAYQVAITEGQQKYNDAVKESGKESLEALKAEASLGTARDRLKKAVEGTIPPLTQQQKLLAAQSQIFKQTEVASGDFARTSDGLANQQRRLSARFEDAKAKLGKGLLPIMTQAADFLLDEGIPAFERFSDWFNKTGIPALKKFGGHVKTTAGHVSDLVGFLKDLPSGAKYAGLAALLGGGAAVKLRGGGGGALGGVGKALGLAKPINVFVVNKDFGGAGVGAGGKGAAAGGATSVARSLVLPAVAAVTIASATTVGISKLSEALAPKAKEKGILGTPGGGFGSPLSIDLDATADSKKAAEETKKRFDDLISKAGVFGDELDLIGNKKVDPSLTIPNMPRARRDLQDFLALQVEAGKPITPYVSLNGYDRVMAQLDTLRANIHALPAAGTGDGGAPFISGGADRSGVSFNGPITVKANDPREFAREVDRRTRDKAMGGRG